MSCFGGLDNIFELSNNLDSFISRIYDTRGNSCVDLLGNPLSVSLNFVMNFLRSCRYFLRNLKTLCVNVSVFKGFTMEEARWSSVRQLVRCSGGLNRISFEHSCC